jgi:hypothetical protein
MNAEQKKESRKLLKTGSLESLGMSDGNPRGIRPQIRIDRLPTQIPFTRKQLVSQGSSTVASIRKKLRVFGNPGRGGGAQPAA